MAYLMIVAEIIVRYRWEEEQDPENPLNLQSYALNETMPAGVLSYPEGLSAWLVMFFADPAVVDFGEGIEPVPAESLVIWPPHHPQKYGNGEQSWRHSWFHATGNTTQRLLREHRLPPLQVHTGCPPQAVDTLLSAFYRETSLHDPADSRVLRNHFENFLIDASRAHALEQLPPENLLRVRRHLDLFPEENLSLRQMADMAHLSVSHFCARFRKTFGSSPQRYQTARRMDLAKHLLATRRLTVSETAFRTGYEDPFHFSRMFKRTLGVSPRHWRDRT